MQFVALEVFLFSIDFCRCRKLASSEVGREDSDGDEDEGGIFIQI